MPTSDADIWVLLDDRAGNRSQALGVADGLGLPCREVEVRYGALIRLPNVVLGASTLGLDTATRSALSAPWPRLVIAAGRRTAPLARWIKKQSGGRSKLVQVMAPGGGDADFDLICRPAHDAAGDAPNTMRIVAAPHRLTPAHLAEVAGAWWTRVSDLPTPRVALIVGGSTRRRTFTDDMARALCGQAAAAVSALGGSLMVTTSRRTGSAVVAVAASLDGTPHQLYRWDQAGENPYQAYLGLADAIIVTGESVSMCSEACATGKPVYLFAPDTLITPKHARLHDTLIAGGHARRFEGVLDLAWRPASLNVATGIADEIRRRGLLA